jgi:hypothetical protein
MGVEKNSRTLDDVGTKEIPKKVMCVYIYIYNSHWGTQYIEEKKIEHQFFLFLKAPSKR